MSCKCPGKCEVSQASRKMISRLFELGKVISVAFLGMELKNSFELHDILSSPMFCKRKKRKKIRSTRFEIRYFELQTPSCAKSSVCFCGSVGKLGN